MPQLTKAMMSEAGAWMARLNGPYRTARVEQGFQQWLKDDLGHPEAFRLVSVDWEGMEELRRFANVTITAPVSTAAVRSSAAAAQTKAAAAPKVAVRIRPWLAAAAVVALTAVGAMLYYRQLNAIATGIGEQRILTLDDGTKVSLNTATRIVVQFDDIQRRIRLDAGEALFDVAKQAGRPFVVDMGERDVTALGTAFLVRRDDAQTMITLIEGKVAVEDRQEPLLPGQRLTFSSGKHAPQIDRPVIDKLTAWRQGKVAIDKMRLSQAVDEMNRYSPIRLVIEQPESRQLLISGVFTAGQSASFARAVAQSYGLEIIDQGNAIHLAGLAKVPD